MSRYIDYDAIDYRNDKMHDKSSDFIDGVIYMAQRIEDAPSIDIEPKRGKWIRDIHPYDKAYHLKCSACGEWGALNAEGWNWRSPFCPNCGASMREREGE